MLETIFKGVSLFVALFISDALMKLFGQPILDLVPSGTWGLEWAERALRWLGTPDAIFWYLATFVSALAVLAIRSSWLTLLSTVNVVACFGIGVTVSVLYRLLHLESHVTNTVTDPAFWIVIASLVAPIVLWAIKRGIEEAFWAREERMRLASVVRLLDPATGQPKSPQTSAADPPRADEHFPFAGSASGA